MHRPEDSIRSYIYAKDRNQPHRMKQAFSENASLEMSVKTDNIAFPPTTYGREEITNVLVRRFAQTYENVYTLCLAPPPEKNMHQFGCDWLVFMSEKADRQVRVGCGWYDWRFQQNSHLVEQLTITIEIMQSLPSEHLEAVMKWVSALPYPWCPAAQVLREWPQLSELKNIREYVSR
ncbi:hypothetical protein BTA51_17920 [Hahella sp. CCB-MM4]|uniref:hypothetical protein n=1 Tax=Hahella sp. (strain CCB-MM4) TaxID=1926491 RepID=UPI000B9A6AFE|nr:hypothetical protein [Hahella sp. CCB-MM4]OZG71885.1 hypothetical protein BTA51_17920 [Hahella sp. CCB-MM4]